MNNASIAEQTSNLVVREVQDMKPLTIGKKYSCEEEWWHSSTMSQKQKEQWRSYVISKLAEESYQKEMECLMKSTSVC